MTDGEPILYTRGIELRERGASIGSLGYELRTSRTENGHPEIYVSADCLRKLADAIEEHESEPEPVPVIAADAGGETVYFDAREDYKIKPDGKGGALVYGEPVDGLPKGWRAGRSEFGSVGWHSTSIEFTEETPE